MMNSSTEKQRKGFSPSRAVWRTQMAKGINTPHRVSRITCAINHQLSNSVADYLHKLNIEFFVENSRAVRQFSKPLPFGIPGNIVRLQGTQINIFRFTVPREISKVLILSIIELIELKTPGRGTIFSQDLIEFNSISPEIKLKYLIEPQNETETVLLKELAYVICVLSIPGSAENLARIALDLGICVPFITYGKGNDIRDELGLIRITISPEKEIVHLIMPGHDTETIIRLLAEEAKLDRPGSGFIYQTQVSFGLIDTRIKIGGQKYAASMEQVIAAIDSLKSGTGWRQRFKFENDDQKTYSSLLPISNCEITIISDEDEIENLREACLKVGVTGAVTSDIIPHESMEKKEKVKTMARSSISIPAQKTDEIVNVLLETISVNDDTLTRILILDSPTSYVNPL